MQDMGWLPSVTLQGLGGFGLAPQPHMHNAVPSSIMLMLKRCTASTLLPSGPVTLACQDTRLT